MDDGLVRWQVDELVEALQCLMSMPAAERGALGERFRRYTNEHYSWDATARQYVESIESVLAKAA